MAVDQAHQTHHSPHPSRTTTATLTSQDSDSEYHHMKNAPFSSLYGVPMPFCASPSSYDQMPETAPPVSPNCSQDPPLYASGSRAYIPGAPRPSSTGARESTPNPLPFHRWPPRARQWMSNKAKLVTGIKAVGPAITGRGHRVLAPGVEEDVNSATEAPLPPSRRLNIHSRQTDGGLSRARKRSAAESDDTEDDEDSSKTARRVRLESDNKDLEKRIAAAKSWIRGFDAREKRAKARNIDAELTIAAENKKALSNQLMMLLDKGDEKELKVRELEEGAGAAEPKLRELRET